MGTNKSYRNEEQKIKNAILDFIRLFPRKGFAWSCYNGGVYSPTKGHFLKPAKHKRKGVPDINGIWCKRPLYIEVKSPGCEPSPEQKEFLEQAITFGAIAFACSDLNVAIATLDSFDC